MLSGSNVANILNWTKQQQYYSTKIGRMNRMSSLAVATGFGRFNPDECQQW
jgi:hypothetical protein